MISVCTYWKRTMLSLILIICVLCLLFMVLKRAGNSCEHENLPKSVLSNTLSLCLKGEGASDSKAHALPPALPGSLPIIGHLHKALSGSSNVFKFVKFLSDDCAKQGGVTVFFGEEVYYLITDPQDALTAAKSCLRRYYAIDYTKVWLGNSLATSSGETWSRHRKLLNPAFSLPVIHGFLDVFNSQAKKLLSEIEPHVGKGPFDHSSYFAKNNFETLCVGTFGIDAISDMKFVEKYLQSAYELIKLFIAKSFKFFLRSNLIYKLSGMKKREDDLVATLHSVTDNVLQRKKLAKRNEVLSDTLKSECTGLKYKPFLDLLIDLSANGELTDTEIREQTDMIMATGFETTSTQLTFTMWLLGAHPEVQDKLYKELLEVLGADRDVEKDDLNKLVYTNAVIMESVRVFPTIPGILRSVDKDVKLRNYTMRAGSYCAILPLVPNIGATGGVKGDQFRPERWLNGDFKSNQEFAGFGLGKRGCMGKTYAIVGMKVVLAHFIRQYRVQAETSELKLSADFVLKPVSGHEIRLQRRNSPVP